MTENERRAQEVEEVAGDEDFNPRWRETLRAAAAALREIDALRAQLAKGLDYQHHTSCGHAWTMRATACPECFANLKDENASLRAQLLVFQPLSPVMPENEKQAVLVLSDNTNPEPVRAQLAEARAQTLREVEDAIHAQLTAALNAGTAMEALIAVGTALRELRVQRSAPSLQTLPKEWADAVNSAKGLCESEANRWDGINQTTAQHWCSVATRLGALYLAQDVIGVENEHNPSKALEGLAPEIAAEHVRTQLAEARAQTLREVEDAIWTCDCPCHRGGSR